MKLPPAPRPNAIAQRYSPHLDPSTETWSTPVRGDDQLTTENLTERIPPWMVPLLESVRVESLAGFEGAHTFFVVDVLKAGTLEKALEQLNALPYPAVVVHTIHTKDTFTFVCMRLDVVVGRVVGMLRVGLEEKS